MKKVFVFGTLKEGFPNFRHNQGRRFRTEFVSQRAFLLYLVGERYSPWLILTPGLGHAIKGQVFEVTDEVLREMDLLERVNEIEGYQRAEIDVVCQQTGEVFRVFVYIKPSLSLSVHDIRMELKDEYLLEHAKLYRPR
ncbi:gamma-glutamylcyclotransferase family protein [Marinomonas posidonica]|uniref:gamma-glutamylcyclotransferase family protein n=1 Tax=Marinomonas posidonica TaxID=936476 RepID=UPI003736805C